MDKILLADDDLDLLLILDHTLTKAGYKVRVLPGGTDVILALRIFEPNLVILDINLGDADGRELCHQIKSILAFQHIPIILYSAEAFPDLKIANCQANGFIKKPFSTTEFLQQVHELITA